MNLFIGCDATVKYEGARDAVSGSYLNSLTVAYELQELPAAGSVDGTVVSGGTGSLAYVAASDGNYRGVIDGAVTALLDEGTTYQVKITATGGGYDDVQYIEANAKKRKR